VHRLECSKGTTAVRAAVAQLADRLAAVGVATVDDGVTIELMVLGCAAEAVERIRALEFGTSRP